MLTVAARQQVAGRAQTAACQWASRCVLNVCAGGLPALPSDDTVLNSGGSTHAVMLHLRSAAD